MNKVAFYTTIFPMKKEYLEDFFESIKNQTYKEFDLIIVNDGFEDFETFLKKFNELEIIELKGNGNIAHNREIGIKYCIEHNYDFLIFGDSDDYFQSNRIEISLKYLIEGNCDIVVNDLTLFSTNVIEDKYISNRIENNVEIEFDFIRNKNIFGLSNTAIKVKSLDDKINIPSEIQVVDWYLFSFLLLKNKKAKFTNETISFYRQYNNNLVGLKELSLESYKKGIEVKKNHYTSLLNIFDIEYIKEQLSRLSNIDNNKLKNINSKIKKPLWWELI
jgi:glycosyltransferase involved in cell wall biosynthesis